MKFALAGVCLVLLWCGHAAGYAKLAETMNCANEDCTETISQGKAKLAYLPRDSKFLKLKKGDVVLVKGKKAGAQTELWGGEVLGSEHFGFFPSAFIKEFMVIHQKPSVIVNIKKFLDEENGVEELTSLSGEGPKITIEKNRKGDLDTEKEDEKVEDPQSTAEPDISNEPKVDEKGQEVHEASNQTVDEQNDGKKHNDEENHTGDLEIEQQQEKVADPQPTANPEIFNEANANENGENINEASKQDDDVQNNEKKHNEEDREDLETEKQDETAEDTQPIVRPDNSDGQNANGKDNNAEETLNENVNELSTGDKPDEEESKEELEVEKKKGSDEDNQLTPDNSHEADGNGDGNQQIFGDNTGKEEANTGMARDDSFDNGGANESEDTEKDDINEPKQTETEEKDDAMEPATVTNNGKPSSETVDIDENENPENQSSQEELSVKETDETDKAKVATDQRSIDNDLKEATENGEAVGDGDEGDNLSEVVDLDELGNDNYSDKNETEHVSDSIDQGKDSEKDLELADVLTASSKLAETTPVPEKEKEDLTDEAHGETPDVQPSDEADEEKESSDEKNLNDDENPDTDKSEEQEKNNLEVKAEEIVQDEKENAIKDAEVPNDDPQISENQEDHNETSTESIMNDGVVATSEKYIVEVNETAKEITHESGETGGIDSEDNEDTSDDNKMHVEEKETTDDIDEDELKQALEAPENEEIKQGDEDEDDSNIEVDASHISTEAKNEDIAESKDVNQTTDSTSVDPHRKTDEIQGSEKAETTTPDKSAESTSPENTVKSEPETQIPSNEVEPDNSPKLTGEDSEDLEEGQTTQGETQEEESEDQSDAEHDALVVLENDESGKEAFEDADFQKLRKELSELKEETGKEDEHDDGLENQEEVDKVMHDEDNVQGFVELKESMLELTNDIETLAGMQAIVNTSANIKQETSDFAASDSQIDVASPNEQLEVEDDPQSEKKFAEDEPGKDEVVQEPGQSEILPNQDGDSEYSSAGDKKEDFDEQEGDSKDHPTSKTEHIYSATESNDHSNDENGDFDEQQGNTEDYPSNTEDVSSATESNDLSNDEKGDFDEIEDDSKDQPSSKTEEMPSATESSDNSSDDSDEFEELEDNSKNKPSNKTSATESIGHSNGEKDGFDKQEGDSKKQASSETEDMASATESIDHSDDENGDKVVDANASEILSGIGEDLDGYSESSDIGEPVTDEKDIEIENEFQTDTKTKESQDASSEDSFHSKHDIEESIHEMVPSIDEKNLNDSGETENEQQANLVDETETKDIGESATEQHLKNTMNATDMSDKVTEIKKDSDELENSFGTREEILDGHLESESQPGDSAEFTVESEDSFQQSPESFLTIDEDSKLGDNGIKTLSFDVLPSDEESIAEDVQEQIQVTSDKIVTDDTVADTAVTDKENSDEAASDNTILAEDSGKNVEESTDDAASENDILTEDSGESVEEETSTDDAAKEKMQFLEVELKAKMEDEASFVNETYQDAMDLRSKLGSIVKEIREMKHQPGKDSTNLASSEAKELKHRLKSLEAQLENWKELEENLGKTVKEEEIQSRITKLEDSLMKRERQEDDLFQARREASVLRLRIQKLERMLHKQRYMPESHFIELAEKLKTEVEQRKATESKAMEKTGHETDLLKYKLNELEKQLEEQTFDNEDVMEHVKEDAEILKKRLSSLEEEIKQRKSNEENLKTFTMEREEALLGRISTLESELEQRKEGERVILSNQQEAANLKEKLANLEEQLKKALETNDPVLEHKLKTLEEELQSRKLAEKESLEKSQHQSEILQGKIENLEKMLQEQKDSTQDNKHVEEVVNLKNSLLGIQEDLYKRVEQDEILSQSTTAKEQQMEERIKHLEAELHHMSRKEKQAVSSATESENLVNRIKELERQVQGVEDKKLRKEDLLAALQEVSTTETENEPEESFLQDMWEIMKSKQQCKAGEIDAIAFDGEINAITSNTSVEEPKSTECMVEEESRVRCGVGRSSQTMCQYLQCCWSPHSKSSVPTCFFSRSQMENLKKGLSHQNIKVHTKEETLQQDNKANPQDNYDKLHEGRMVDWDESVDSKDKKPSTWDEAISPDEPEEFEKDSDELKQTNEPDINKDEEPANKEENQDFTEQTPEKTQENLEDTNTEESINTGENTTAEEETIDLTEESNDELKETNVQEWIDAKVSESDKVEDASSQPENTSVDEKAHKLDESQIDHGPEHMETSNERTDKTKPSLDEKYQELEEFEENQENLQSFVVKLFILLGQLPYDLVYVVVPLANWWLSLLPAEYQNDVHGVPWHIILSTIVIGFILIWILVWRLGVSKRKRRVSNLNETIFELKKQLEDVVSEKLTKENELKIAQSQLDEKSEQTLGKDEMLRKNNDDIAELKNQLTHLQNEFHQTEDQLATIEAKYKQVLDEKETIVKESQQASQVAKEGKSTIADLEKSLAQLKSDLQDSKKEKRQLEETIQDSRKRLKKEEKQLEDKQQKIDQFKKQKEELSVEVEELKERLTTINNENQSTMQEVDVLKDCLLQFKGITDALTEDGDDDLSVDEINEKQKEKLKNLIDVAGIQRRLKQTEIEKSRVNIELEAERKSREETEARIGELEAECENERTIKGKTERDLQLLQAKLNVMQEFYAKREVEMQGKLGKEQTQKEIHRSQLAEQGDKTEKLLEQLEVYKRMNEEAKKEYEEAEKQRKGEISQFEKKAHSNWLASREAERKLDEANREMSHLRIELADYQQRIRELEEREPIIIRPRPMPPPGPFPGRHGHPQSPLPMRNGSMREHATPPPRDGRRGTSPTGSLQDEMRHQSRPSRPPSMPSHSERRPPSQGFADLNVSAPPLRRGPPSLRDGSPPPPLMRDGPPPIREPLLPMRDGPPPMMRDGPPPIRDGPPPMMRDGPPPFMRDGPPPMRDGPPPMRDGPPPMMRDMPPHVMRGIPPSIRGGPPNRNGHGSRPGQPDAGPMTSSPYMDRPMIPPSSESPLRPPPPHGPYQASSLHSHTHPDKPQNYPPPGRQYSQDMI